MGPKSLTSVGKRFPLTTASMKNYKEQVNGKKITPSPPNIEVENER